MAAYVVTHVQLRNEEAADRYRRLAEESVRQFSGRYLARAPDATDPGAGRIVIIEFPSLAVALDWKSSEAYGKALAIRNQAMSCTMGIVPGLDAALQTGFQPASNGPY